MKQPAAIRHAANLWTKWEPRSLEAYCHSAQMPLDSFLGDSEEDETEGPAQAVRVWKAFGTQQESRAGCHHLSKEASMPRKTCPDFSPFHELALTSNQPGIRKIGNATLLLTNI